MEATDAIGRIALNATDRITDHGVVGAFVVLLFVVSSILLWVLLRDKEYQKRNTETLSEMVENQKLFTQLYQNSQNHHKEIVALISDVTMSERSNTKDCYRKVENKLNEVLTHVRVSNV